MKNQFEDAMSKRTDEELIKIINSSHGEYQTEAIRAAELEIKKREFTREKLSKYSDEQILEILNSKGNYQSYEQPYEVVAADSEAKKRKLNYNYEEIRTETKINEEIQKLKIETVNERYPTLRFISSVYRILAWIILLAAALMFFYPLSQGQMRIPLTVGIIVIGGILFVTFFAAAEAIKVFIDIEHNTRITAMNSKK